MLPQKSVFWLLILTLFALSACNRAAPPTPAPQVDTQATIDAAVAATDAAQAAAQVAIENAVNATLTAEAAQATPTPLPAATATPLPADNSVAAVTEDELTALIDEAVTEAFAASDAYANSAQAAAAAPTAEEVQSAQVYYVDANQAIVYAEELLQLYDDLYGDLAYAAIDELNAMESDLEAMTAAVSDLNNTMTGIANTLDQGLEVAEDTIAQAQATADAVTQNVNQAQENFSTWYQSAQTAQEDRRNAALSLAPNQVSAEPRAALQSTVEFAKQGQSAAADYRISAEELTALAQQGANAAASLQATGNPQLQPLSEKVNAVTAHLAEGNIPQAQADIQQLSRSVDALKTMPEFQGLELPQIPALPQGDHSSLPSVPSRPHRK